MPDTPGPDKEFSQILRDWNEIRLVEALAVVAAGIALVLAIKWLFPRLAERLPNRFRLWVLPWEPILRVIVLVFLFAYVVPLLINPTPENLLAIFGTFAVALGFAFKDYASSLMAGVVALYERPYRNGDWVKIEETYGEVQSHDLRTVNIRTPDDTLVAVPHGKMWTTSIYNSNCGKRDLLCIADFYLHPDHDGVLIRENLRDVALTSPFLNFDRPIVVIAAEQPWGTHYRLKAYPMDGRDQFLFITDLTLRGKQMLRRINVKPASVPPVASPTQ